MIDKDSRSFPLKFVYPIVLREKQMLNKSISGLTLHSSASFSPILALTIRSSLLFTNSYVSKLSSPLFLYRSEHNIIMNRLTTNYLLSSIVASDTVVTKANETYSSGSNPFDISTKSYGSLQIYNCKFTNVNDGVGSLLKNIQFIMENTYVQSCQNAFLILDSPFNKSAMTRCTFIDCRSSSTIISIKKGSISFSEITIKESAATTFFGITQCTRVYFDSCFLYGDKTNDQLAISITSTQNTQLNQVQCLNFTNNSINIETSKAVLHKCCFSKSYEDEIKVDDPNNVANKNLNYFIASCPYKEPSTPEPKNSKAYAIATVVVFFLCFVSLFITLIVLVICKTGQEEKLEYGVLHDVDEDSDMESEGEQISD